MRGPVRILGFAALVLAMLLPSTAVIAASSLLIWPLDPTIEAGQKAGMLWLENVGDAPVTLQIRVRAWDQEDFADRYTEQNVVVGTPPFTTVAPGKKQLVRFTLLAPLRVGEERAFRVLVDEIPAQTPVERTGLKFQMRYSLPLFVYGEGLWRKRRVPGSAQAAPSLSWQLVEENGVRYLQVNNTGTGHARLSRVRLVSSTDGATSTVDESIDVATGLLGYVLPGRVMRWPAPEGVLDGRLLQVQLEVNAPSIILTGK
jgi:fimbrial chaperone protein